MKKDVCVYLDDIIESIQRIEEYTRGVAQDEFFEDAAMQDAVMRRLGIIGEAVKNVPDAFKVKHSSIPWREMAGMRDVLIHEYSGVNLVRVWKTVKKDIPDVKKKLRSIYTLMR